MPNNCPSTSLCAHSIVGHRHRRYPTCDRVRNRERCSELLANCFDVATASRHGNGDVNAFVFHAGGDETFVHQLQEHVHPFEHPLDLQNFDGVLQVRKVDLKKVVPARIVIEAR